MPASTRALLPALLPLSLLHAQPSPGQMAAQQAMQMQQMHMFMRYTGVSRAVLERQARARKAVLVQGRSKDRIELGKAPEKEVWRLEVEEGSGGFGFPDGDQVPFMRKVVTRPYPRAHEVTTFTLEMVDLRTGQVAWRHELQDQEIPMPVLFEGIAVYGTEKFELVALDRATGKERFRAQLDPLKTFLLANNRTYVQEPVLDGDVLYTATNGKGPQGETCGKAYAVEARSGRRIWAKDLPSGSLQAPMTFEDMVLISSGPWTYGLSARDGKVVWETYDADHKASGESFVLGSTAILICNGTVMALDARTGRKLWTTSVGGQEGRSAVMGDGDKVFLIEHRIFGRCFARALDVHTGQTAWEQKLDSRMGICWIQDGTALLQRGNELLALALADGKKRWHLVPEDRSFAYPVPMGLNILLATAKKKESVIQAIEFQTGKPLWTHTIHEKAEEAPALAARDCILFQAKKGNLICLR